MAEQEIDVRSTHLTLLNLSRRMVFFFAFEEQRASGKVQLHDSNFSNN